MEVNETPRDNSQACRLILNSFYLEREREREKGSKIFGVSFCRMNNKNDVYVVLFLFKCEESKF
jgi:hypothetical protein